MYCLKCGRDTTGDHVFCDTCQKKMEQYPVAPGTVVHLPHRPAAKKTAPRKRTIPPEEQILNLRRALRRVRAFALALLIILVMTTVVLLRQVFNPSVPAIGQNYTIDTNQSSD